MRQVQRVPTYFLGRKKKIQSTLVISNSKGLSEILAFHKCIRNLTPGVRATLKILWKRGEIAP